MSKIDTTSDGGSKIQKLVVKFGAIAAVLLVVFLLGFLPMWMSLRTANAEHEKTRKELAKQEILNSLTVGIIDARRGEYESARQEASDFYSKLRAEIEKENESAYTVEQIAGLKSIFADRDAMITLLAQRDQASVERLTDVFLKYQKASGGGAAPVTPKEAETGNSETKDANINS